MPHNNPTWAHFIWFCKCVSIAQSKWLLSNAFISAIFCDRVCGTWYWKCTEGDCFSGSFEVSFPQLQPFLRSSITDGSRACCWLLWGAWQCFPDLVLYHCLSHKCVHHLRRKLSVNLQVSFSSLLSYFHTFFFFFLSSLILLELRALFRKLLENKKKQIRTTTMTKHRKTSQPTTYAG